MMPTLLFKFLVLIIFAVSQVTSVRLYESFSPLTCRNDQFPCSLNKCIEKYKWCDGNCDCSDDCHDENKCSYDNEEHICDSYMFPCFDGSCIPQEGRCDGYHSCVDGSDEFDCGCEELFNSTDTIKYYFHSERHRHRKCWNIKVPPSKYLDFKFLPLDLHGDCQSSQITVKWREPIHKYKTLIICNSNRSSSSSIEIFDNAEIVFFSIPSRDTRYNSYPSPSTNKMVGFKYTTIDIICKRSDVFKCTQHQCIVPEKKCDEIKDCENGLDEIGCEKRVFTVEGVNASRHLGLMWLKNQRNAAWGWRENTHRAVVAMYLAHGANFNGTNKEEDLTAKQLELQMTTAILRNGTDMITPTQMSMYINALLVICHDPRNFYGYNLVRDLKEQVRTTKLFHPLPYLALCNAGELPSEGEVEKLLQALDRSSDHGFMTDIQSVAIMALSCVADNNKFAHLKENINNGTRIFKELQQNDGSFGNIYTTALVVQALLASGNEEAKDWNLKASIEYLKQKQNKLDGSFGDFLATYLILPILNRKSLMDVGRNNCSVHLKMPRDGNPVGDIESKLGNKITVHYFLYIGDQKDQEHPITLRTPENITVIDMMRLAAEADPKYKFAYQLIMNKAYIYEISGIANDPEDGKFWLLYTGMNNASLEMIVKSPNEVIVKDAETVIMWYKSAKILKS